MKKEAVKKTQVGAAIAIVLAGLSAGLYQTSSLLQMFATFGSDTSANVGGYNLNARGEPFFLFDTGDSTVGRWERHVPDRYGSTPGTIWINGVPWKFTASDSVIGGKLTIPGLQVYTLPTEARAWITPPLEINVAAQDSLWFMGGNLWIMFDDCVIDSVTVMREKPLPIYPRQAEYAYQIFYASPDSADAFPVFDGKVNTRQHSTIVLRPGDYKLWLAMIDDFGMQNHWIGPVRLVSGVCQ